MNTFYWLDVDEDGAYRQMHISLHYLWICSVPVRHVFSFPPFISFDHFLRVFLLRSSVHSKERKSLQSAKFHCCHWDISYYTFLWNYINENGKRRRRKCGRSVAEDMLRRRRHGTPGIGAYTSTHYTYSFVFFPFTMLVQRRKRRRQYLKCSLQMQWVHISTCYAPISMHEVEHSTTICWVQHISEDVERLQWNSDKFIYVDINEV